MRTRKMAAVGALTVLIALAASAPAQAGLVLNGLYMNGLYMNGLFLNGPDQPVGFNFNALKLHAVVLPTGAQ